jgi:hypothetical protein
MISQSFNRNKKRKIKTTVTVAKPPSQTTSGGDLSGFEKFEGYLSGFIVEGLCNPLLIVWEVMYTSSYFLDNHDLLML